jgi:hypothetical protein
VTGGNAAPEPAGPVDAGRPGGEGTTTVPPADSDARRPVGAAPAADPTAQAGRDDAPAGPRSTAPAAPRVDAPAGPRGVAPAGDVSADADLGATLLPGVETDAPMPVGAGPIDRPLISAVADAGTPGVSTDAGRSPLSASQLDVPEEPFAPAATTSAIPVSRERPAGRATATATATIPPAGARKPVAGAADAGAVPKAPSLNLLHASSPVAADRPARDVTTPADPARVPAPAPIGAVGGAAVGASAATAGIALVALACALLIALVGGWSRVVLLFEAYRPTVVLALPERPG